MKQSLLVLAIGALLALLPRATFAQAPDPRTGDHIITRTHQTMGTLIVLTAWTDEDDRAIAAFDQVFAEFDRIDLLMSTWKPASDISRINAAAGAPKPVVVTDEVAGVLKKALWASRISGGAFDITFGAFSGVWKFDEDNDGTLPSAEEVAAHKKLVNWRDLLVTGHKVRLRRAGQKINLGGIAKGYAVDRAVKILHDKGLVDFIVQAGGDLYASGRRGDRAWKVGIRDPRAGRDVFFAFADVSDVTFSTSGDYERFVLKDGKRYHHILDPATGYPATKTRSVTVMAKDAITADAISKALFIKGPVEGLAFVEKLPDVQAVWVGADNAVTMSSGLKGKITIIAPPTNAP